MIYLAFVAGSCETQTPQREGGFGVAILDGAVEDVENRTRGDVLDVFGGKGNYESVHHAGLSGVLEAVKWVQDGDTLVVATNASSLVAALTRNYEDGIFDRYVNGDLIEDIYTIAGDRGITITAIQCDKENPVLSIAKETAKEYKNKNYMKYIAYTDGCSRPHLEPHNGGWAYIVLKDKTLKGIVHKNLGYKTQTTNNEMEITAIVELMKWLPENSFVEICADSLIAINACSRGIVSKDSLRSLATEYERQRMRKHITVKFTHVKGHSDDIWNDRVDILTNYARNTADIVYGVDFDTLKKNIMPAPVCRSAKMVINSK